MDKKQQTENEKQRMENKKQQAEDEKPRTAKLVPVIMNL